MVIVEGPDGAGKTTLVQHLIDKFDLHKGERGTSNRDLLYTVTVPDTLRALGYAANPVGECRIWDRLYFSDFVYAPIQGREVAFNDAQQTHIWGLIHALRCPVIVCLPPWEVVRDNAHDDHQMAGVLDNLGRIYNHYTRLLEGSSYFTDTFPQHTVVHDYTESDTLERVESAVINYLDHRKQVMP